LNLFVRCGPRYEPPAGEEGWTVIDLEAELRPEDLPVAVERVRESLRGQRRARVLVAGPVALGIALGQGLAHEPVAIEYLQLNQVTKGFEVWLTNRRNL
jgi:hypothetical protein